MAFKNDCNRPDLGHILLLFVIFMLLLQRDNRAPAPERTMRIQPTALLRKTA